MGGFITGSPVWASDFIRGHGKDPDFINILVNAEQIPPVCRFSPAARALRRSTFASPIRTVDNAFKIIGLHIVHSQVRDDFGIPVESKKRHGDDHRQDAQMVNIRSHARQCQLADLGSGSCESGRVERCVSLEKSDALSQKAVPGRRQLPLNAHDGRGQPPQTNSKCPVLDSNQEPSD